MALSTIYLSTFKTYFNRNANRFDTIQDYDPYISTNSIPNVNFNPNDGLNTELVLNILEDVKATYLIETDPNNVIKSRWYIMEQSRTTQGQYTFALHRDTIADSFDKLLNAPIFVERGILRPDDPMIFNDEGMSFNLIKQNEILLKDRSECPWIVGYYSKKGEAEGSTSSMSGTVKNPVEPDISLTTPLTSWEYYKYLNQDYIAKPNELWHIIRARYYQGGQISTEYTISSARTISTIQRSSFDGFGYKSYDDVPDISQMFTSFDDATILKLNLYAKTEIPWDDIPTHVFLSLNGKVLQTLEANGVKKKYRISVSNPHAEGFYKDNVSKGQYYTAIKNKMANMPGYQGEGDHSVSLQIFCNTYRIILNDITDDISYQISTERYQCTDAPYDIFAIPYGNLSCKLTGSEFVTEKEAAMGVANSIAAKYSGTYLYDLQLLPYCPIPPIISADGEITLTDTKQYSLVKDSSQKIVSIILHVSYAQFTNNIVLKDPIIIRNPKIESQTDKCRLCSPNYNGQFEFTPAKNGGVSLFNVDCTYKPYSPYIHVNPNFSRLYGKDYNDARGLVCGGDFSLATVTDKWQQYEINNKNYLNTFNRQIENMETINRITNVGQAIDLSANMISKGVMGAITGSAGMSAVNMMSAGITGGINMALNRATQREALDYSRDQFAYSLDNIQALPYSLNRVSAYTANNKLFPFLEIYSCTDEEKAALEKKIKYRSMSVGRIGTLREFISYAGGKKCYIKARLIIADIEEDAEYYKSIADELDAGIYIGGGY